MKLTPLRYLMKHIKLTTIFVGIAGVLLGPGYASAIVAKDLHSVIYNTTFYEACGTGDSPSTTTSTGGGTLDLDYKDPARGNRDIPITVYLPSDGQKHPLLVFAPGRGRSSKPDDMYGRYLRAIADQGFVVAGMDFIDNATPHWADDGQDVKFAVDKLLAESQLSGKVDTAAGVGGFGHSDGGGIIMGVGYGDAQNPKIKAILSASGAANGTKSGPPLLAMYGTNDFNASGGQAAYDSVTPSYKALAKFVGADHTSYLQGGQAGSDQFNPATDALTAAFFKRFLEGVSTDATDLKKVAGKYNTIVQFTEQGNNNASGTGGGTGSPLPAATDNASATCCPQNASSDTGGGGLNGGKVYQVGDSLSVGMLQAGQLVQKYKDAGFDATVDANGGRSITSPGMSNGGGPYVSGLDAIDRDKDAVTAAAGVVVELGTNDMAGISADTFKTNYTQLVDKIKGINGKTKLFFVNIATYAASGHGPAYTQGDQVITQLAQKYNAVVIDWDGLVKQGNNATAWLDKDPMHLHPTTGGGYDAFAKLIVDKVKQGGGTATPASTGSGSSSSDQCCGGTGSGSTTLNGKDNVEKVWNFLTGKGLKPYLVAAIMGNIKQEGNFDPTSQEPVTHSDVPLSTDCGGYICGYGIVGWTPGPELIPIAQKTGMKVNSLEFQLNVLWAEVFDQSMAQFIPAGINYGDLGTRLKATTDVVSAEALFEKEFERHANPNQLQPIRLQTAQEYLAKFGSTTGANPGSPGSAGTCDGGTASADGWTFPLKTTQSVIKKGSQDTSGGTEVWCFTSQTNCHHDYNAADIMVPTGTPVLSPVAGTVISAHHATTDACIYDNRGDTISIHGDDGKDYFMGHFGRNTLKVNQGDKLTSGQEIAAVGTAANAQCTVPHLHIQQNPAGDAGGQTNSFNIQPILVKLFNMLPQ